MTGGRLIPALLLVACGGLVLGGGLALGGDLGDVGSPGLGVMRRPSPRPPATSATLFVARPSGSGLEIVTCASVRDLGAQVREYHLRLEGGGTVVLTIDPYRGSASYVAGDSLTVTGSFFEPAPRPAAGDVLDVGRRYGNLLLSSGDYRVAGAWDCSGREPEPG